MDEPHLRGEDVLRLGGRATVANAGQFRAVQEEEFLEQEIAGLHLIFVS